MQGHVDINTFVGSVSSGNDGKLHWQKLDDIRRFQYSPAAHICISGRHVVDQSNRAYVMARHTDATSRTCVVRAAQGDIQGFFADVDGEERTTKTCEVS